MTSYESIPDLQLRAAVEDAIITCTARGWPLFFAMRSRGLADVACFFDADFPSQLAEFLETCAKYAFPADDRDDAFNKVEYDYVSDPDMRRLLERPHELAGELGAWYFAAFVIPTEDGRVSSGSIFEYSGGFILPQHIAAHLVLSFKVAIAASLGPACLRGRPWDLCGTGHEL